MEKGNKKKSFSRRDFLKQFSGGALSIAVVPRFIEKDLGAFETKKGKVFVYTKKQITLTINGELYSLEVEPRETLLQVLRERIGLTGAKRTCDRGECGGCTVLLDETPVYSCHFLAVRANGRRITTIEGLARGGKLHPLQQAFIEKDGYQCGFCTPGFIMTSLAFLNKNKNPTLEETKRALSGNLCRCGNYTKIYDAVLSASRRMRRV